MTRAGVFETILGFIVITVAAAFLVYAYGVSGKTIGADKYRVGAVFGRVDGITIGSEVRIAGVKVGAVSANRLNLQTYEADLQFDIDRNVPIPEDSVAKIVSDGLIGGAHVAIEPGASDVMLREGEKITITQGSVDLLGLAVRSITSQDGDDDDGEDASDPLGEL